MTDEEVSKVIADVTRVAAQNSTSRELRTLIARAMWPLIQKAREKK